MNLTDAERLQYQQLVFSRLNPWRTCSKDKGEKKCCCISVLFNRALNVLFEVWSGNDPKIKEPQAECVTEEICKNQKNYRHPESCEQSAVCGGLYFSVLGDLDQNFLGKTWQIIENYGIRYICMQPKLQESGPDKAVYYGEDVEKRLRTLHFTTNIVLYARRSETDLALRVRNLQNTLLLVNAPLFRFTVDYCHRSMVGDSQVCLGKAKSCLDLLTECIEFYIYLYHAFEKDKNPSDGLAATVYGNGSKNKFNKLLEYTWSCATLSPTTYHAEVKNTSGENFIEAHCNLDTLCTWLEQSILDFCSPLNIQCIESILKLDGFKDLVDQFDNMKKVILGGALGSGRLP